MNSSEVMRINWPIRSSLGSCSAAEKNAGFFTCSQDATREVNLLYCRSPRCTKFIFLWFKSNWSQIWVYISWCEVPNMVGGQCRFLWFKSNWCQIWIYISWCEVPIMTRAEEFTAQPEEVSYNLLKLRRRQGFMTLRRWNSLLSWRDLH